MLRHTSAMAARAVVTFGLLALLPLIGGCGEDDSNNLPPATSTAVVMSTATATPTVTPTATPEEEEGAENLFGSTVSGGGALTIDPFAQIPVFLQQCAGDTCFYSSADPTSPGFKEADDSEDEPGFPLFHLPDGVAVTVDIISIDSGISLQFDDGMVLNAAGQTLFLGTTPGIHRDLFWQLTGPSDEPEGTAHHIAVKLTTTSAAFTESAVVSFNLVRTAG